jgi:hypothetical protein
VGVIEGVIVGVIVGTGVVGIGEGENNGLGSCTPPLLGATSMHTVVQSRPV